MTIDPAKLTPPPWKLSDSHGLCIVSEVADRMVADFSPEYARGEAWEGRRADAEFIVLARHAFDVMMRRGWSPSLIVNGPRSGLWIVVGEVREPAKFAVHQKQFAWEDPFTALVEAEAWYQANVAEPSA